MLRIIIIFLLFFVLVDNRDWAHRSLVMGARRQAIRTASGSQDVRREVHHGVGNGSRKRPRRAAACSDIQEKSFRLSDKTSVAMVEKNRMEEEVDPVNLTKLEPERGLRLPLAMDIIIITCWSIWTTCNATMKIHRFRNAETL
jgi:hypothetical protein